MNSQEILQDFIENKITKGRVKNISPQDDLLSNGILDSLGILQLVAFIDESLGVQIPDEDVVFENFQSIEAIINYIKGKES